MKPIKAFYTLTPAAALTFGLATFGVTEVTYADNQPSLTDHHMMQVTKSPTCGCCGAWVELAREEGYEIEVTDTADIVGIKSDNEIPRTMWACHTAKIDGYVIEGHVPFLAIAKLLKERPDIIGIAVPGMPNGSPGMGNDPTAKYNVLAFGGDASENEVFWQAGL